MEVYEILARTLERSNEGVELTRRWRVKAAAGTSISQIEQAPGIPRPGTAHPDYRGALLAELSVRQIEGEPELWEVEARYSTDAGKQLYDHPALKPPEVSITFSRSTRAIAYDITGKPISNSAGDPFSDPVEIDDSRPSIVIRRNFLYFNFPLALQYKDAVNSDGFLGFAPGELKIMRISAQKRRDEDKGYEWWEVEVEMEGRPTPSGLNIAPGDPQPEGWDVIVVDQGRYRLSGGSKVPIVDAHGKPVQHDVRLNGSGDALPDNAPPSATVWRVFRVYRRLPFSGLGLL